MFMHFFFVFSAPFYATDCCICNLQTKSQRLYHHQLHCVNWSAWKIIKLKKVFFHSTLTRVCHRTIIILRPVKIFCHCTLVVLSLQVLVLLSMFTGSWQSFPCFCASGKQAHRHNTANQLVVCSAYNDTTTAAAAAAACTFSSYTHWHYWRHTTH